MSNKTIDQALKILAKQFGVTVFDANDTAADYIEKIAGGVVFGGSNPVTVAASNKESYWGTAVSAMQTGVTVTGNKISGTLHKLTSGQLVTDWGEGYFIALKFTKNNAAASDIKVGLRPSVSSGLVSLDPDMDAVIKITDKDEQKFVVVSLTSEVSYEQVYDLSELVFDED